MFSTKKSTRNPDFAKASAGKIFVHSSSIEMLTRATWKFARRTLWCNFPLNSAEKELSKILIREFYENIPAKIFSRCAKNYFKEYCQRILLQRNYVGRSALRYIPHPCIWLDLRNLDGFPATKVWYEIELKLKKEAAIRTLKNKKKPCFCQQTMNPFDCIN